MVFVQAVCVATAKKNVLGEKFESKRTKEVSKPWCASGIPVIEKTNSQTNSLEVGSQDVRRVEREAGGTAVL